MADRSSLHLAVFAVTGFIALSASQSMGQPSPTSNFVPVSDAMLQNPAPEDWLMWRRTLDG